jgi:2-polyprenyl-3-methyl-5-hydroxy-6-metoxy-1,4-benzoquinol methylase
MNPRLHQALSLYSALPWRERFHVEARAGSAPLSSLVARTPAGKVADIGCGHGLLSVLLAQDSPRRQVIGVDPDERKIRWAQAAAGQLPNVSFRMGRIEDLLPEGEGTFDAVVVADVLYLLPEEEARSFLAAAFRLLKPGGRLINNEAEADGSWRAAKWLAQEWVMVRLLRRTHGGGTVGLVPREEQVARLQAAGFRVEEVRSLARGYSSPHMLLNAQRPAGT